MCRNSEIRLLIVTNLPRIYIYYTRLVLELKLPPADAYFKLKHVIEEVNAVLIAETGDEESVVSPQLGTVCESVVE